jgi:chitinase
VPFRAFLLLLVTVSTCQAADIPPHPIVVYHDSWNETAAASADAMTLASLPAYISVVDLAFVRPDLVYLGKLDISQTGLEYRSSGKILHDAIALLKSRNPGTRVLLSVGGAVYTQWSALDVDAIVRLTHDLGADGVDVDFESSQPGCNPKVDGQIHCQTDATLEHIVRLLRTALPRPALLTAAVWSVGAYGEGDFRLAQPFSRYTGFMLGLLRSPTAADLDLLSIQAYDAGTRFDPLQAWGAYRALWHGPLALGLAVQRDDGAGPFPTEPEAETLAGTVASDPLGGMMIYPILGTPDGRGSAKRPDGLGLAKAMCRGMRLIRCDSAGLQPVRERAR